MVDTHLHDMIEHMSDHKGVACHRRGDRREWVHCMRCHRISFHSDIFVEGGVDKEDMAHYDRSLSMRDDHS